MPMKRSTSPTELQCRHVRYVLPHLRTMIGASKETVATDSTTKWSRRTLSSSSPLSEECYYYNLSPPPITKARVPFSWEYLPGIPKNTTISLPHPLITPNYHISSTTVVRKPKPHSFSLPLPPSFYSPSIHENARKQSRKPGVLNPGFGSIRTPAGRCDPFITALIECSREATNDSTRRTCGNNNRRCRAIESSVRKSARSKIHGFPIKNFIGFDQLSCKSKRSSGVVACRILSC